MTAKNVPNRPLGQQGLHGQPGDIGKGQIHQRDAKGAAHIEDKQLQMRLIIGEKYRDVSPLETVLLHVGQSFLFLIHSHDV